MRTISLALLVVLMPACGGSLEFVVEEDDTGFPIIPEVNAVPGGQAQATLELLATGSHVDVYSITVTPDDPTQLSATVRPTSAQLVDGVAFPVTVTITVDDAATSGRNLVMVGAVPPKGTEPEASISVSVIVQ